MRFIKMAVETRFGGSEALSIENDTLLTKVGVYKHESFQTNIVCSSFFRRTVGIAPSITNELRLSAHTNILPNMAIAFLGQGS